MYLHRSPETLEQLQAVIPHYERLAGTGDGVVVLEEAKVPPGVDEFLEVALEELKLGATIVFAGRVEADGEEDLGGSEAVLEVAAEDLHEGTSGEVAGPVSRTTLREDVGVDEEVAAEGWEIGESLLDFLRRIFCKLFEGC